MNQKLLTIPLRVGFEATRTAVTISMRLTGAAIHLLRPSGGSRSHAGPPSSPRTAGPPTAERTSRSTAPPEARTNGQPEPTITPRAAAPAPPPPPVTPPQDQPDTPLSAADDAVKTIDDEDEVVAEYAEAGAEEGAGAQLDIEEPWEGYADMNADTVISRIGEADAATLAVVELFEHTHKQRQTVLAAAEKRLRALSPPGSD